MSGITQRDLLRKRFKPLSWLSKQPPIPTEGLVMFGGMKKRGKSYWCLQYATEFGLKTGVLYFALEDGERRLNRRLKEQKASRKANVTYEFELLLETPAEQAAFKKRLREARQAGQTVFIIDNLARVKTGRTDEDSSGSIGDIVHWLQQLAMQMHVLILVVHHHGKKETGDPGNDLRGSSAIAAAGDLNIGLYWQTNRFVLRGEGRDIDPFALRLMRIPELHKWQVLGDDDELEMDEEFEGLRDVLAKGDLGVEEVARALNITRQAAQARLSKAMNEGHVVRHEERRGQKKATAYVYRWQGRQRW